MTLEAVAEFKLSITKALADQLAETLYPLRPSPLSLESLAHVQSRPGVYILFLNGARVYVGKTAKGLDERLKQHRRKISGRSKISLDDMSFVCVYVDRDMDSVAPEKMLIAKYASDGGVPWNNNGFGNKDPGRQRDTSLVKSNHFDAIYPIDLDVSVDIGDGCPTVGKALDALKKALPFNLRYEKKGNGTILATSISIPTGPITAKEVIPVLLATLPKNWQATALPGYMILYPGQAEYASATGWWRWTDSGVGWVQGQSKLDEAGEIKSDDADEDEE
jgi:hypothetical protein